MAHLIRALVLALLPLVVQSQENQPLPFSTSLSGLNAEANLCDLPPRDRLCGVIPHDVTGFTASNVYMLIERSAQDPFDLFAWKSFVAINWPQSSATMDSTAAGDAGSPRRWQSWEQPEDLFPRSEALTCVAQAGESGLPVFRFWRQADGNPLVDRQGNYLVYDVRINPELSAYIRDNQLHTISGQQAFLQQGDDISFPAGFYDNAQTRIGGNVGSIAIKSAWRVLIPAQHESDLYVVDALLALTADDTLDQRQACIPVRLGLVAMHITHRTASANGGHGIWATFEHDNNAPFSDVARGPNNIFAAELFPDGCGVTGVDRKYLLYDPQCETCAVNAPPNPRPGGWKWALEPPYARYADGDVVEPAQIARCWRPALSTEAMNRAWKHALRGTLWANYSLSTTQWRGAPEGELFPAGEVPRYLTSSTMESFLQTDANGSCLGCHVAATTRLGQSANSSFLLLNAN